MIGKPDHDSGDPTRFGDWSLKLKSYMGAVDSRYHQQFAEAEQSADPILSDTRDNTEATLKAQLYSVLVMLSMDTALDKCCDVTSLLQTRLLPSLKVFFSKIRKSSKRLENTSMSSNFVMKNGNSKKRFFCSSKKYRPAPSWAMRISTKTVLSSRRRQRPSFFFALSYVFRGLLCFFFFCKIGLATSQDKCHNAGINVAAVHFF